MADAIEAVEPEINTANIADNVNDRTPDPEPPPVVAEVVDETPEPPRPDNAGLDELRALVTDLGTKVDTLSSRADTHDGILEKIAGFVTGGSDDAPGASEQRGERRPWTHRL